MCALRVQIESFDARGEIELDAEGVYDAAFGGRVIDSISLVIRDEGVSLIINGFTEDS